MRKITSIMAALLLVVCAATPSLAKMAKETEAPAKISASALREDVRSLWAEHVAWTRLFIVSSLAGLEDANAAAERLLRNQDDLGNAIKPFYGEVAGKKLSALLRDHILIAAKVVQAAKDGNNDELVKQQKAWSDNGGDIAKFMSNANPNWPEKDVLAMLGKHLELTTDEVVARLHKDWAADIKAYDEGYAHMIMFADVMSDGLIKQFPKKVTKQ